MSKRKAKNEIIDMGPCMLVWGNDKIGEINKIEIDHQNGLLHFGFEQNKKSKQRPDIKTLRIKPIVAELTSTKIRDWIVMPRMRKMQVSFKIFEEDLK